MWSFVWGWLLLPFGCALRLDQQQAGEGGGNATFSCSSTCAKGLEAGRICPFADALAPNANMLATDHWYWRRYQPCDADRVRIELSCGGMVPGSFRKKIRRVLGGKHVVMIGDSTTGENYIGLLCMLWEEKLITGDPGRAVFRNNDESAAEAYIFEATLPELGHGTRLTFIRKNFGPAGKLAMRALDTADITVGNLGLHYFNPHGTDEYKERDNTTVRTTYARDAQDLMRNMIARGRPGHRAIWRETVPCPVQDSSPFGCTARSVNPRLEAHKEVLSALPAYKGVEVLQIARLYEHLWWAHPGGSDCCHVVHTVPGLLSAVPRMLVSMLAQPPGWFVDPVRWPKASHCPDMNRQCISTHFSHSSGGPEAPWYDF